MVTDPRTQSERFRDSRNNGPEQSDADLAEKLRKGDDSAYGLLAERYAPLTEKAVRKFSPSFAELDADAVWGEDDLRQCAALALYRAAMSYDGEKSGGSVKFGLYARICVNNALISELRKARAAARRRGRREAAESRRHADTLDEVIQSERFAALTSAVRARLAPLEREVFELYIEGMSVEQIAGLLGRDNKSVSNALYRMKGKIKGLLQKNP